jgi:hypothetical protein
MQPYPYTFLVSEPHGAPPLHTKAFAIPVATLIEYVELEEEEEEELEDTGFED